MSGEPDWLAANRANWDERVGVHLGTPTYDLAGLRAGQARLTPIEEAELGPVDGLRVMHLQCHFGLDTLTLAQRGARVVGLDFSARAIAAARALADELGLAGRADFVEADLYSAPQALAGDPGFDLVFTTWGTISWLPDIGRWAAVVAHFLRPGGRLYFADGHPTALVFDDLAALPDGRPGYFAPYCGRAALVLDDPTDYADPTARLASAQQHCWIHPLGDVISALHAHGMRLDFLHEHPAVPWQMFRLLRPTGNGLFGWPDEPWLPLAFSLAATRL